MSTASWDIYAEQMAHLKYGFPLWSPDPPPGGAPIELGDVGWVREGEFIPLFNAFRDSDDRQPHGRVPAGFSPLSLQDMMIRGPREKVSATMLCSRGIKSRNVSAGVAVNAGTPSSPSGTIDFSFECYEDSGALLVPRPRMMEHVILSTRPIRAYMETHFDTWFEFGAHTLGFDIKEDDIRFVIGTMKTSQWEVAAFRGHSRKMIGHFSGALGSGAAHLAMSTSDFRPAEVHHRAGPPGRLEHQLQADGDSTASSAGLGEQSSELGAAPTPVVYDQCVFIHYYKRKRRRLPPFGFRLKGGAGPSELPRRPEDDRGLSPELVNVGGAREDGSYGRGDCLSPSSVSDDDSESEDVTVDPVDYLLDYILQKTSSDTAIASDLELYASLGRHWQVRAVSSTCTAGCS
ncbi:hypothetical protein C8Q78DRAFT_714618 [Trametes maxima]|nr:hypothetical protein C8Q78DRAFT_714618 [Trametes maxima]